MENAVLQRTKNQVYAFKAGWLEAKEKWKPGVETPQDYRSRFCETYPPDECCYYLWAELFEKYYPRRAGFLTEFKTPFAEIEDKRLKQRREEERKQAQRKADTKNWEAVWNAVLPSEFYSLLVEAKLHVTQTFLYREAEDKAPPSLFLESYSESYVRSASSNYEPYLEEMVDNNRQKAMGRRRAWLCDQTVELLEEVLRRYMIDNAWMLAELSNETIEYGQEQVLYYAKSQNHYAWVSERKASWSFGGHAYSAENFNTWWKHEKPTSIAVLRRVALGFC